MAKRERENAFGEPTCNKSSRVDQDFTTAYVLDVQTLTDVLLRFHIRNPRDSEVYLMLSRETIGQEERWQDILQLENDKAILENYSVQMIPEGFESFYGPQNQNACDFYLEYERPADLVPLYTIRKQLTSDPDRICSVPVLGIVLAFWYKRASQQTEGRLIITDSSLYRISVKIRIAQLPANFQVAHFGDLVYMKSVKWAGKSVAD